MNQPKHDLVRVTLGVLLLGGLILGSLWILRPFLGALIWATTIVVSTWPILRWFQKRLWGSRLLATGVMTALLLLIVILPLGAAIGVVVVESDRMLQWARGLREIELPGPPEFVRDLPGFGASLYESWKATAAQGPSELATRLAPYADDGARWLVGQVGHFGYLGVQFLLTVVLAALLYARGENAADNVLRFGRRVAGARGEGAVLLAGGAIRAVALGVGITAIVQSALGGIGLWIAGVPFVGLLTGIMLLLCIAQLGPTLVLAPATLWVFWKLDAGTGTFLLVWTIVVGTMDNFLRPLLIRRGANLPLLLIFAGVIGGLLAFGLIGLFVGPVVLAVSYRLLEGWIGELDAAPSGEAA